MLSYLKKPSSLISYRNLSFSQASRNNRGIPEDLAVPGLWPLNISDYYLMVELHDKYGILPPEDCDTESLQRQVYEQRLQAWKLGEIEVEKEWFQYFL